MDELKTETVYLRGHAIDENGNKRPITDAERARDLKHLQRAMWETKEAQRDHRAAISKIHRAAERALNHQFTFKRFMMDLTALSSGMLNFHTDWAVVKKEVRAAGSYIASKEAEYR